MQIMMQISEIQTSNAWNAILCKQNDAERKISFFIFHLSL